MLRNCVSGKKHDNTLQCWFIQGVWRYNDTSQGATLSQEQIPGWQILRFERCQSYQYYWTKLKDEKLGKGARAHIIGQLSQVQILIHHNRAKVEMHVDGLDDDVMMVTRPKMQIVKAAVDTNKIKQQYTPFSTPFNQFKLNVKTERIYLQEIMQSQRQKENMMNMSTIVVKQEQRSNHQPLNFFDTLLQKTDIYNPQKNISNKYNHLHKMVQYEQQSNDIFYQLANQQLEIITFTQRPEFEAILNHQIIKELNYQLLFQVAENDYYYWVQFEVLQKYTPTLLLDYINDNNALQILPKISSIDTMAQNEYEIECIVGKRQELGQVMYAVKWEGFPKSEITWETLDSFNNISELFVRRFERCQSYRYFWLKLQDKEQGSEKKRVHIIQSYSQVQLPFKPSYAYMYDHRSQYSNDPNPPKPKILCFEEEESNYYSQGNPDPIVKKPRGRPRKVDQDREAKERLQQQQMRAYNHELEQQALSPYAKQNSKLNISKSERTYFEEIIIMQKLKDYKTFKVEEKKQDKIKDESTTYYPAQLYKINTSAKMDKLHHKTKIAICFKQTQTEEQFPTQQELYDDEQTLTISQTQCFDQILSHQVLSEFEYRLYFKCLSQDQECLYVDYNQLQQYNPTLLLDYMTLHAKLL